MSDETQQNIDVNFKFTKTGDSEITGAYTRLQNQLDQTRKVGESLNQRLADIKKAADIKAAAQTYGELAQKIGDSDKAASLLATRLQQIGDLSKSEIASAADEFERMKTAQVDAASGGGNFGVEGLRRTGGAINQLTGGSELGGLIQRAGDIGQVAKEFKNIGDAIPFVSSAAETLTPILGASAAGFAAVALPLAAIAAVVGAVSLGVKAFNEELERNREATKLALDGLQRETDFKNQNITDARSKTAAQNLQDAMDQEQRFKNQQDLLATLRKQRADIDAEYANLGSSLNPQRRGELGDIGKDLDTRINDASLELIKLGEQVENTVRVLGPAVDANQKVRDAIEAATKAQKEHEQAVKDAAAEQKRVDAEIEQARKQLLTVNEQLADAEKKRAGQLANRVQEDQRAVEVGALENAIQAAQEQEAAQANADKIVQIRAEGGEAEAKALMAQAEKINQINSNFFIAQQKALQSYLVSEQRATEDYNRQRVRKIEDLNASLLNLAGQRDVAGFVNTRTTGLLDIARGDEDAGTASQRRRQDYERQAAEADANRQRQLADLMRANEQENTARRAALNAKIQQEIEAGKGTLKQSQILQNQLAALRQRYAVEDLAARRRNEDEAYTTQVGKLRVRQAELNAIISGTLDPARITIVNLGTAVVDFINRIRAAASGSTGGSTGGTYTPTPNVSGGGRYTPTSISGGVSANYSSVLNKGSGMTVVVNNPMFGAIATPADVTAGQHMIITAIEKAAGVV